MSDGLPPDGFAQIAQEIRRATHDPANAARCILAFRLNSDYPPELEEVTVLWFDADLQPVIIYEEQVTSPLRLANGWAVYIYGRPEISGSNP